MEIADRKGKRVEGYLVICEQAFPYQGLAFVQKAFDSFSKKFKIAAQTLFVIDELLTFDRAGVQRVGQWPVGVCVIDVKDI